MLLEFQNKTNIEITGLWLMHFRFALDFSDIDLWNKDMLDAHLNFLDTVSNKQFGYLHNIFKTCSRHVFLKDENLLRWRRDEEVFKTNKCLIGTCLLKYHRYCVEKLWEINWLMFEVNFTCYSWFLDFFIINCNWRWMKLKSNHFRQRKSRWRRKEGCKYCYINYSYW